MQVHLPRHPACVFLVLLLLAVHSRAPAQETVASSSDAIWIEGENASRSDVSRHGWYDGVKKDTLSGNEWLSHFNERKEGTAEFDFDVAEADRFTFWIRANPVAAKLSYKLDDSSDWTPIDLNRDQRGNINIASDNKPDLRFICWVKVGVIELSAGRHKIAFRMNSGPQNHGGIDCFVFTRIPFVPSGAKKPTIQSAAAAPDAWFPVVMDDDAFSPDSIIDISNLVEAPAGKHGFLKRDHDTLRFENASTPTKFWAINGGPSPAWSAEQMTQAARWYRKHGLNLIRQHTVISAVGLMNAEGEFNPSRLDHYDRWFATLKEQGIYTTWSVIYPHHGRFLQKHDDIDPALFAELDRADEQADGNHAPISVNDYINLEPSLQAVAWKYFQSLLNHVNPYTGLAYKDDPCACDVGVSKREQCLFLYAQYAERCQQDADSVASNAAWFLSVCEVEIRQQREDCCGLGWSLDGR